MVAQDGRQALDAIGPAAAPTLVLLDIMMPELSGFEVLEAMARERATTRMPVLILTARADEADVRRGLALGARRYLSKPFDVRALMAEVRRHLGSRERERAQRRGEPMKKKILVVDDEDDILHFLELVLREKGYEVVTASGGHEALTTRPDRASPTSSCSTS